MQYWRMTLISMWMKIWKWPVVGRVFYDSFENIAKPHRKICKKKNLGKITNLLLKKK